MNFATDFCPSLTHNKKVIAKKMKIESFRFSGDILKMESRQISFCIIIKRQNMELCPNLIDLVSFTSSKTQTMSLEFK